MFRKATTFLYFVPFKIQKSNFELKSDPTKKNKLKGKKLALKILFNFLSGNA